MTLRRHRLAVALALALAACAHGRSPERAAAPLYSPNGQPLSGGALGQPSCQAALTRWFDGIASGGAISREAFLADARTQFAAMDLDKDGLITPAELAAYRAPYATTARAAEASASAASPGRGGRGGRPGRTARAAAGEEPLTDQVDPVMIADRHLRNAVSLDDFLTHAGQVFAALDADRDGTLSRAEVLRRCPPPG